MTGRSPLSLTFGIPDHPWVDSTDGADVRICMTVGAAGDLSGLLLRVRRELPLDDGSALVEFDEARGKIQPDLTVGPNVAGVRPLRANERLCWQGCKLVGAGFQVSPAQYEAFVKADKAAKTRLRRYWAGSDLTKRQNPRYVIDFFEMSEDEARSAHPELMQHIVDHVLPERAQNRDRMFRERWWVFGRPRPELREANANLRRFVVTSEVARNRFFTFLGWPENLIDGSVIGIASDDAKTLGVLSSRIHVTWALAAGGRLGVGNDPRYQNGPCFDPFPFPDDTAGQDAVIRKLAEQLDAHRKERVVEHPDLTMTDMYNVLSKLRIGAPLKDEERTIHDKGLLSVLKRIHEDLDTAVAAAYGWPADLPDEQILERLVALNAERVAEENRGLVRWLRPEFQSRGKAVAKEQIALDVGEGVAAAAPRKAAWPKTLPEQVQALRTALAAEGRPATAERLARSFKGARSDKVEELLETLATLGQARRVGEDRYVA